MKKGFKIVGLILLPAIISLPILAYTQYKKLLDYNIKIKGLKILTFTKSKITFDAKLLFSNKSLISLEVLKYNIDIILNGKNIATLTSNNIFVLESKKDSSIDVRVDINPSQKFNAQELIGLVSGFLTNRDKVIFEFNGKMSIKKWKFEIELPINLKYTLKELMEDKEENGKN